MLRATGTLSRISRGIAGLSLSCPAEDTPGMQYLRTGGAVALLLQLLWGTVVTSSISWELQRLPEMRLVPCLYDQTTAWLKVGLESCCRYRDFSAKNWIIEVIFRKVQHCWIVFQLWALVNTW